ncbi:hypothetical protein C8Q74DRAFT_1331062 [Fomes fomentarius]|nr:hypothetical protein C8Q74DRAFT_1331062 [Fomes fomentarius]
MSARLALVDLSLARAALRPAFARRLAHQAPALSLSLSLSPHDSADDRSLYANRSLSRQRIPSLASAGLFPHAQHAPLTELEQRIAELKEAPIAHLPEDSPPTYSDLELISIYEDLLSLSSQPEHHSHSDSQLAPGPPESAQNLSPLEAQMSIYATSGDVASVEHLLATLEQPPSPLIRDLHIKAHLRAMDHPAFPTTALTVLHQYETRALPAPQSSYTRLITSLLSLRSTLAEAQAWDLFAHMRYVAHPVPDPYLYTLMISACASRLIAPQPARALDLFKEMTVDNTIPPTAATYTAVIYACACSGEKLYVGEAFRLAKEMLDGHRDAYGNTPFTPDRKTFCALLEGAKRLGDLAKVRWILAEIVAEGQRAPSGDIQNDMVVDEQIMTHVFHAYAAYKTPFIRSSTVLVDENSYSASAQPEVATSTSQDSSQESADVSAVSQQFTALLPQSRSEVISETRALFARVLSDIQASDHKSGLADGACESMPKAFQHVELSPRLLNAFLSVHYRHSSLEESIDLYLTIFAELGVEKNAWSYVEAVERAGRAERDERKQALKFAREVWQEWDHVEDVWRKGQQTENEAKVDARLVERAYTAMVRILALTGHSREAVDLVRRFFERYPAHNISPANPRHPLLSTRTVLQAPRPLVRLMSPTEVPDNTVPPMLSFPELEVLHHRLLAKGDRDGIGYLKYVCMTYAGALKRRKEATLQAKSGAT